MVRDAAEYDSHEAEREARLLDGRAWDDYCDVLKAAGQIVLRETPDGDPQDRVEGFRYLTRMNLMAAFRVIERFTPTTKGNRIGIIPPPATGGIGVQSPNQDHIVQPVDSRYRYHITGTLGDAYCHLSSWSPPIPDTVGAEPVGLNAEDHLEVFNPNRALTPHSMVLADIASADGEIDFIMSVEDPADGSTWFPMVPDTRELMGRVVYDDRNEQRPPRMTIRCLDEHDQPTTPPAEEFSARLATAAQLVLGLQSDYGGWTRDLLTRENGLLFTREWYERIGGSPDDRHFEFGYWRVAPDEALIVEFDEPECQHWNFQLCNHWMENMANYSVGTGYVDRENAVRDGKHVRVIVSDLDTGAPNWIEPGDRNHGVMGLRFVRPKVVPEITTKIVKVADL